MKFTRRRAVEITGAIGSVGLAGCLGSSGSGETTSGSVSASESQAEGTQWFNTMLEDVRTGETFRLTDFDQPVLIQMFAIWCSKCDAQERTVDQLRVNTDDFRMVSVNVDPNEDDAAVQEHADSNGYEWQWVTPPSAFTGSLADEFGSSITHPPSVPMVLLCPDGSYRRLERGVKSVETLKSALDSC